MCDSMPCQGARQCGQFRWGGPQVLMPKWDHPRFSLQNAACRVGWWCRKSCVCAYVGTGIGRKCLEACARRW